MKQHFPIGDRHMAGIARDIADKFIMHSIGEPTAGHLAGLEGNVQCQIQPALAGREVPTSLARAAVAVLTSKCPSRTFGAMACLMGAIDHTLPEVQFTHTLQPLLAHQRPQALGVDALALSAQGVAHAPATRALSARLMSPDDGLLQGASASARRALWQACQAKNSECDTPSNRRINSIKNYFRCNAM